MSNPLQQTRISLRLRKRNLEQADSGVHASKRQSKETTESKQSVPAFGAPVLEERKLIKRTVTKKKNETEDESRKRKVPRQATLKEHFKLSSSLAETSSVQKVATEATSASDSEDLQAEETLHDQEQRQKQLSPITKEIGKEEKIEVETTKASSNTQGSREIPTENDDHSISPSPTRESIGQVPPSILSTPASSPLPSAQLSPPSLSSTDKLVPHEAPPTPSTTPITTRTIPVTPSSVSSISAHKSLVSSTVYGKSLLPKLEKERTQEERSTLDKLVAALDITLTFHAARNIAAFFHKIQPMLRNSTKKNITISHLCKVLFVAPELYDVEVKLLKEFGKDLEAHQVSIGHEYSTPLDGKAIQGRKELIEKRTKEYFEEHQHEENTTIPEKELPRLERVVDQKKWLEKANLPPRVKSILELQEKRKAAKEEKASQPPVQHQGSAKDRAKALLERIRNKQKK